MKWQIIIMPIAEKQLVAITDRRVQRTIRERIDGLENEPEKQGKALTDDLAGYRSLRAAGQRYRIIYRIESDRVEVLVVTVGLRKEGDKRDVYALAKKLLRLGLLEPE